jgi:hypothetical protein
MEKLAAGEAQAATASATTRSTTSVRFAGVAGM